MPSTHDAAGRGQSNPFEQPESRGSSPSKDGNGNQRAPISHPYPPAYRTQTTDPPSQSYTYDQRRRPSQSQQLRQSSFSDSPNPYDPRSRPVPPYQSAGMSRQAADNGERGDTKEMRVDVESAPNAAIRGPKIGKGQYAENWTQEDEEAERVFIKSGMFQWKQLMNWRFWIRSKWWYWYVIVAILCVLVGLMTIYHDKIVTWLTPVANWMKALPAGWTIPIAVLFILSFPPLFGQEIVCVLVGAVWGLWVGFGIVAAGTFIGEIGNFYAFKYCLRSHAVKLEEKNPNYACLAHIVREGGFFLIFVIRLSAVPGHFSTAVFATCGMSIWIFSAATILTLPKQLIIVYLGVIFADQSEKSNKERIITYTTLIVGLVLTAWSGYYIYRKMYRARIVLWRRERLAAKAAAAGGLGVSGAPLNRRISYIAMLEQPQDDIEALSPMLPKHARGGGAGGNLGPVYETPYELQQVPPHSLHQARASISSPLRHRRKLSGLGDRTDMPDREIRHSRRESATLPDLAFPDPDSAPYLQPHAQSKQARTSTDPSSDSQHRRTASFDTDRDRPLSIDQGAQYGYNPNASSQVFPTPQPHRAYEEADLGLGSREQAGATRGFQLSDHGNGRQ